MIARMREYRKLGLSEREIAFHLMVSPSTVHEYTKDIEPVTQATVESQRQPDLGETPVVAQQVVRSDIEASGSAVQAKPTRTAVNNVGTSVEGGSADQSVSVEMGQIVVRWNPNLILQLQSSMNSSGYQDLDRWWSEFVVPRLHAFERVEEYLEFPKPDEGDSRTRTNKWFARLQYHMDNSLKYLQAVDEMNKEAVRRQLTMSIR